jgi:hypothetical protein
MLHQLEGKISGGPSPTRLVVQFTREDGTSSTFAATMTSPLPPWNVSLARLAYDKEDQIAGDQRFTGKIGPTSVDIDFANGVTIKGKLDKPTDGGVKEAGAGAWTSH